MAGNHWLAAKTMSWVHLKKCEFQQNIQNKHTWFFGQITSRQIYDGNIGAPQYSPPCWARMEHGEKILRLGNGLDIRVAKEQGPRILEVQGIDCRVEADDTLNTSNVL